MDIPIELISAQIAGATGPITLAGCILEHTVELLAGLVLFQVIKPGQSGRYGGAPCIFNMKTMYNADGSHGMQHGYRRIRADGKILRIAYTYLCQLCLTLST